MELAELLPEGRSSPVARLAVAGLAWDSRRVRPGELFFALPGTRCDGHSFVRHAARRGAVAAVGERPLHALSIPYLQVESARAALAQAACRFYGHPTAKLAAIAVTGTNGKTTVVHLLGQLLPACDTLTTVRVAEDQLSCVTTPEAPDLQRLAARAAAAGKRFFAFEASSIGLAQHRVDGVQLSCAVFTGLGRDHLDFHKSQDAYLAAKLRLFHMLPPDAWAVVNVQDRCAGEFLSASRGRKLTYGIERGEVRAADLDPALAQFTLLAPGGRARVRLPFPGRHNLANALAATAVAWALGQPVSAIADRLSKARLPPGRFHQFHTPAGALAVVDYAHTPEALAAVLEALRPQAERLVAVFGAPGDRDPGKRPLMGEVAGRLADLVVITADNPQPEDPQRIAEQIASGICAAGGRWEVQLDRKLAIREALAAAGPGDVVLIAGKGHERYQLTASGPRPHSDLELVRQLAPRPADS
ncbi:MAG: UDP-N-acetylmuramoyl-L-alanyl-D-glutamate--2,6-diaminopimelate ligase [Candidatus Bipolaricaulaceae bacterium]